MSEPPKTMREVELTQGMVALVDDADYEELSKWRWCAAKCGRDYYAVRTVYAPNTTPMCRQVYMHRQILGLPRGDKRQGDHVSGDTLDNRRENLRAATRRQNQINTGVPGHNTSGVKGVGWNKARNKWRVRINLCGKDVYLGLFDNFEEAEAVSKSAMEKRHGEYARKEISNV